MIVPPATSDFRALSIAQDAAKVEMELAGDGAVGFLASPGRISAD
jgi:hypothetical protein